MLESIINVIVDIHGINLIILITATFLIIFHYLLQQYKPAHAVFSILPAVKGPIQNIMPPFFQRHKPEYDPLDTEELNNDLKPYGFAYDPEQEIFFSIMEAWQRQHGYCKSYDLMSPFINLIFDSEPIYFDYDNRRWLIEFWKGQYGMTTGGEVGVYVSSKEEDRTKTPDLIIYDSVSNDELLPISFILKKNGYPIFTRSDTHWWVTGFKLGEFSKPSQLSMDITIEFKDEDMCKAFVSALKKTGYKDAEIQINNNLVSITFAKPHTRKPFTLTKIGVSYAQATNKRNCSIYNYMTRHYSNTLDKLNYIKQKYPILYKQMLNISRKF